MCRLLGLYGQIENWKDLVFQFQTLAESGMIPPTPDQVPGHKDGWGMARSNAGKTAMLRVERQLGSAFESQKYSSAVQSIPHAPHIFLCHLRKASPKVAVTLANTHPFFAMGWAFIHNGTVFDPESLPLTLTLPLTSDEYLFHFLLGKLLNRLPDLSDSKALREAVSEIDVPYTALNTLMSNGADLFVIRRHAKQGQYYALYYYPLSAGVIVCSEPLHSHLLKPEKWHKLPNHVAIKIHGMPPEIETLSISSPK